MVGFNGIASLKASVAVWGYEAWPHQVDALERAQQENIILNLPTGTGKTLVACLVMSNKFGVLTDESQLS